MTCSPAASIVRTMHQYDRRAYSGDVHCTAIAVQCTSPLYARRSYWCIVRTMEAAGLHVIPYQATVPSFGVWGFALAMQQPFDRPLHVNMPLRFLDDATL